jgi:vancomycin resistance protein YoaR
MENGRPARDGAVGFKGAEVVTTQPRVGRSLEADAVESALTEAYVAEERSPAALELVDEPPEIGERAVARARSEFANPAVASAVTLSFQGEEIRLEPASYTPALSLEPVDGALVPRLDAKKLTALVQSRIGSTGAPVDARVVLEGGEPRVVPSKPGVTYDRAQVRRKFLDLVDNPSGKRTLEVDAKVARPDFTTAEAKELGIEERVSTFTTYYPHAEYRNVNLGRAAQLVDGTVLKPGETFSLNGIVGERTHANGFTEGYIIEDGILVGDLGGGVSQLATTTFNAMFFAGLEDVEHKPHSFYIDRYPIGREATIAWGYLDLKFRNDTDHGVLVHAVVQPSTPSSSGSVTVSMYSTKVWDIRARTGERYNFTEPKERRVDDVKCHENEGFGGFDINVWRDFRRVGSSEVVRSEKFHTTYTPSDTVICTNPDAEDNIG